MLELNWLGDQDAKHAARRVFTDLSHVFARARHREDERDAE